MRAIAAGIRMEADLSCEFNGHAFSVKASDDLIVVEVSSIMIGIRLIRELSRQKNLRFDSDDLKDWLQLFRSSLEIHVGGVCVATGGAKDSSYLARFFSFKGIRLLPVAALRMAFWTRP